MAAGTGPVYVYAGCLSGELKTRLDSRRVERDGTEVTHYAQNVTVETDAPSTVSCLAEVGEVAGGGSGTLQCGSSARFTRILIE